LQNEVYEAEMSAIRHILFPYDFSDHCDDVVPFVRALAQKVQARITLLSVAPPGEVGEAKDALQHRLDRALPDAFPGLIVERVADVGDAAFRIADFSAHRSVDLVMLPTHGLGLFRTMLIGSVTAKVLHDATCPVWTAAHAETQTALALPRTIVCALDDSQAGAELAQCASAFARCVGARLQLLHALGPISDWTALESERRLQERVREQARAQIGERLRAVDVDAPLRVAVGGVVQTIVEEARQEGADLIILGRGSVSEPFGRLRTHAFGIIHRAPCPVVSV
jgi:nucleotide-binding universal stress UspA family protein